MILVISNVSLSVLVFFLDNDSFSGKIFYFLFMIFSILFEFFLNYLGLKLYELDLDFRILLVCISIGVFILLLVWEKIVVRYLVYF